ncbi:hypothetical protein E2I00_006303, partial [Balaenoptera physalus]
MDLENPKDPSYSVDDVIVLEIEVKGSVEPFQVLLEPYAIIIPGENYVGMTVKKDFKPRLPEMVLNSGVSMGRKRLAGPAVVAAAGKLRLFPEPRNPLGLKRRWARHMWNNSKSAIRYTWGKISDCHVIEVEPCAGTIGTAGTEGGAGWGRRA